MTFARFTALAYAALGIGCVGFIRGPTHRLYQSYPIDSRGELGRIASTSDGTVYIGARWPSGVIVFRPGRTSPRFFLLPMIKPQAIVASGAGPTWIADSGLNPGHPDKLARVDSNGVQILQLNPPTISNGIGPIATDGRRVWYAANRVSRFGFLDLHGNHNAIVPSPGQVSAIAIDGRGSVWLDLFSRLIVVADSNGHLSNRIVVSATGHDYTPFMAYDSGRVWFAGYNNIQTSRRFKGIAGWIDSRTRAVQRCPYLAAGQASRLEAVAVGDRLYLAPWPAQPYLRPG